MLLRVGRNGVDGALNTEVDAIGRTVFELLPVQPGITTDINPGLVGVGKGAHAGVERLRVKGIDGKGGDFIVAQAQAAHLPGDTTITTTEDAGHITGGIDHVRLGGVKVDRDKGAGAAKAGPLPDDACGAGRRGDGGGGRWLRGWRGCWVAHQLRRAKAAGVFPRVINDAVPTQFTVTGAAIVIVIEVEIQPELVAIHGGDAQAGQW